MKHLIILALAALSAGAAQAAESAPARADLTSTSPGYTYFNRADADWSAHEAELSDCYAKGSLTVTKDAGAMTGALPGLIAGYSQKRGVLVATENCMVVRGWRVVQVPEEEGKALSALSARELAERLKGWVGAAEPHGLIVRRWTNEAADGRNKRNADRAGWSGVPSLSILASPAATEAVETPSKPGKGVRAKEVKYVSFNKIADIPPGSALVLIRLKNSTLANQVMMFTRVGQIDGQPLPLVDPTSNQFGAQSGPRAKGYWAVIIPAGTWRISSMGAYSYLNFCLGSPQFEVHAGDVLHLGNIDMNSMTVDMSSGDLSQLLADKPELLSRLRPAIYLNGSTDRCADSFITALEFPGVGYVEGYSWGGARGGADASAR